MVAQAVYLVSEISDSIEQLVIEHRRQMNKLMNECSKRQNVDIKHVLDDQRGHRHSQQHALSVHSFNSTTRRRRAVGCETEN